MKNEQQVVEIDLLKLLQVYLKKWYLIVIVGLLGAAISFSIAYFFVDNQYRANITIYVDNTKQEKKDTDMISSGNLNAAQQLVNTYITIIKSNRVMTKVADYLNVSKTADVSYTYKDIQTMTSASQVEDTEIFTVYVVSGDPSEAQRVANAIAYVAPDEISAMIEGSSAWVIDDAEYPEHRFSPSYTKYTTIGGVIGVVIILIYLFAEDFFDRRLKTVEDLAAFEDIAVIGTIPDFSQSRGGSGSYYKKYGYGKYGKYTKEESGAKNE